MFLDNIRETVKEIGGFLIKFRYPTLIDEVLIESKKTTLTRGQYVPMSMSFSPTQLEAVELVDMLSTLSIIATFEKQEYSWDNFCDEDGKDFVKKCYNYFLEWRSSFRKRIESDGGQPS